MRFRPDHRSARRPVTELLPATGDLFSGDRLHRPTRVTRGPYPRWHSKLDSKRSSKLNYRLNRQSVSKADHDWRQEETLDDSREEARPETWAGIQAEKQAGDSGDGFKERADEQDSEQGNENSDEKRNEKPEEK